jgi:hypothetical protein
MCDGLFLSFDLLSFMLFYVGFFCHVHHLWVFPFDGFFLLRLLYILFLIFRWIFIFQRMASTPSKRCELSIGQKLGILEALKSKKSDDVAKDFNIGYSTVKKIRQNEEEIRKIALNNGNLNRKRKCESPEGESEENC